MQLNRSDLFYFSENDRAARKKFLETVETSLIPKSLVRHSPFFVPNKANEELPVDWIYIEPSKKKTLTIFVSGVHGAEAFAGSAIQSMILKEFGSALAEKATQRGNGFIFIHAFNPYGFRHQRRATENNINLNRNFSTSLQLYSTKNEGYRKVKGFLQPQGPVGNPLVSFSSLVLSIAKILKIEGFTKTQLSEAISSGQFEFPDGLEYGGQAPEPQVLDLIHKLRDYAAGYEEIVLLDLHTGLGENYALHLIPGDKPESATPELFSRLFRPEEDREIYEYTTGDSEGFYHTIGDLNDMLPELLTESQRRIALTIEFGTLGNDPLSKLRSLHRLIRENQGAKFGYQSKRREEETKRSLVELFLPSDDKWKMNAIARSRELVKRIFDRL